MVNIKPEFGENILYGILDSLDEYILITMEEPWNILKGKIRKNPKKILFNSDMRIDNLEKIEKTEKVDTEYIVGFGGGTVCDTARSPESLS